MILKINNTMRLKNYLVMIILMATACHNQEVMIPVIIPKPNQMQLLNGRFDFKKYHDVFYDQPEIKECADLMCVILQDQGLDAKIDRARHLKKKRRGIYLILVSDSIVEENTYQISVHKKRIVVKARNIQNLKYGIQTINQLAFFSKGSDFVIPCMEIADKPAFQYRGMHLDVSRHFMPVDFIKKYIDYLALLKFNYFHWHLVDDQGWRIEIKKYPRLTEIGSVRKETLVGHSGEKPPRYDGIPYGGFYTQKEIKDIVQYAALRNVTIIPEIEIPGHSQAAIASYPFLGCTGDKVEVLTKWGISPYIYNLEDTTFKFLFAVMDEVAMLFPGKYIHVGGDEAVKDQWRASRRINSQMKALGIKNYEDLQSYFINRIADHLAENGKQIIGWAEIIEGNIRSDAIVMCWRSWTDENIPLLATEKGHQVILTPNSHYYFDYYQWPDTKNEPLAIGGLTTLDSVYLYDPVPVGFNPDNRRRILGGQANVWTEYLATPEQVEYMIFPRMLALSEVLWTDKDQRDFGDFKLRVEQFERYLKFMNINYARHYFQADYRGLKK
jgi:hexosaminidase